MSHRILLERSQAAFSRVLRQGKADTNLLSRLRGHDNRLLSLGDLLDSVTPGGESSVGIQDIPVDKIIGSENKADDFSREFYPRKLWMGPRWTTIHSLLIHNDLSEAISVFEIGGCYFLRDGHHRVSAAKALDRVFMTANVRSISLPYQLPADLDRNMLPLIRAKDQFHRKTGMFSVIPESEFKARRVETWAWLEREICEYNRQYFTRRFGRQPDSMEEQIHSWYKNLYQNAMNYIHHNSLPYLFPGYDETDVFVEMIRFWNSFDQPDDLWLGDMYKQFISRQSARNPLAAGIQRIFKRLKMIGMSPEDEYRFFKQVSHIYEIAPDFSALPHNKAVYRLMYTQLVDCSARVLQKELDRAPYIHELTEYWYTQFYKPVSEAAFKLETPKQQTQFYQNFSHRWFWPLITRERTAEEALCEFQ
jgi:hypothetical protein